MRFRPISRLWELAEARVRLVEGCLPFGGCLVHPSHVLQLMVRNGAQFLICPCCMAFSTGARAPGLKDFCRARGRDYVLPAYKRSQLAKVLRGQWPTTDLQRRWNPALEDRPAGFVHRALRLLCEGAELACPMLV